MFMRFNVSNTLIITVAPHLKIPYVDNMPNAFRQKDTSYTHIQNTMYRIASKDYVSYFYVKNSVISYYRQLNKYEGTYLPNNTRNTYKFIEFEKDNQDSQKTSILLAKSIESKWYVIAINVKNVGKKYDIIVTNDEASDNTSIEHIKWDLDILKYQKDFDIISYYPFYNDILVILRHTKQQIILQFLNILENSFNIVLWNLDDISKLVFDIINNVDQNEKEKYEISDDIMEGIDDILVVRKEYLYGTCLDNRLYVRSIRFECKIKLKGGKHNYELGQLYIYITMKEDDIKCYWDFNYAYTHVFDPKSSQKFSPKPIYTILCKQYLKDPILFTEKYKINIDKKCNDTLRNNDCYYIKHGQHKKEIIKIGSWLGYCGIGCIDDYSLYHYKNYYIIICQSHVFKLAIVDRKSDFIGIMITREFFPITMQIIDDFECYYSSLKNKLVFLSNDLVHLFFIDAKKIDDIFNRKYKEGCKYGYDEKLDLIHYFSVPEKLSLAINNTLEEDDEDTITGLVAAYIDRKSDKLYILAKYKIEDTEHYGLFMWDMADNGLNFRLVYRTLANIPYNSAQNNKIKYVFDVGKLILWESEAYGFRKTKLMNLDIVYIGSHRFVSMRYNRISRYVPVPSVFQFETLQCYAKSVKNVEENVIVVYYDCSRSYTNSTTSAYHYFVLSSMSLVKKIPTDKLKRES